ncbi:MAG: hypothetical protein ACE5JA_08435 [bacterium]
MAETWHPVSGGSHAPVLAVSSTTALKSVVCGIGEACNRCGHVERFKKADTRVPSASSESISFRSGNILDWHSTMINRRASYSATLWHLADELIDCFNGNAQGAVLDEELGPGYRSISLDGGIFSPRIHFYRLQADEYQAKRKMTFLHRQGPDRGKLFV